MSGSIGHRAELLKNRTKMLRRKYTKERRGFASLASGGVCMRRAPV
jgi:hypothetical protein